MSNYSQPFLSSVRIMSLARNSWNGKSDNEKRKIARKYNHFFRDLGLSHRDWSNTFDMLTKPQRKVLFKRELIKVYDSLDNSIKSNIMKDIHLRKFSSKWFKMPSCDKRTLLNYLWHDGQE